jgi:hypothetical protein
MTVTILATFEPDPVVEYACQVCGERFIGSLSRALDDHENVETHASGSDSSSHHLFDL